MLSLIQIFIVFNKLDLSCWPTFSILINAGESQLHKMAIVPWTLMHWKSQSYHSSKKKEEGTLNRMCKISMQECSKSEFVLESLHSTWINDSLSNKKKKYFWNYINLNVEVKAFEFSKELLYRPFIFDDFWFGHLWCWSPSTSSILTLSFSYLIVEISRCFKVCNLHPTQRKWDFNLIVRFFFQLGTMPFTNFFYLLPSSEWSWILTHLHPCTSCSYP